MTNTFSEDNFTVLNKNGKNILFRTDDLSVNELTLTFINKSQEDIVFKGGDTPSALLINMSFLRDGAFDPVKDFKFGSCEGWEPVLLVNKKWAVWKLVCKNEVVVPPGKSISFVIKNIFCKKYDPGYFYISATDIPDYDDIDPSISKEFVVKDPDRTKEPLPLAVSYTDLIHPINSQTGQPCEKKVLTKEALSENAAVPVYLTYDSLAQIKNGFTLLLTTDEEIVIPEVMEETKKPAIRIMFLFGTYPYQVTTINNGNDIEINANQVDWKVKHEADSPFWECVPSPQTIKQFTSFSFDIRRLVTQLNAVEGVSLMYVQVNNFGDFSDNVYRFQLVKKVAKPPVISLKRDKAKITVGENVKLSWNSMLANKVEITYRTRENQHVVLSTAPKPGEQKIELTQCEPEALLILPTAVITTFEATAYGPDNAKVSTSVTIDVKQKVAEIVSFIATPALTEHGVKTKVTLSWDVRDASQLKLLKGDVELDVTKTTSREIEVDAPHEYKLVARSYGDELPNASKSLKLYTSKVRNSIPLDFYDDKAGDRPKTLLYRNDKDNNRFLFAHCGQDHLYQIDVLSFRKLLAINNKRGQFALHPEKLYLVAFYNGRDGKYIYGQAQEGRWPETYQFGAANNYVTDMKFSPDGNKLFFSFVAGNGTVQDPTTQQQIAASFLFNKQQVRMTWVTLQYNVGIGPTTIAFDNGSSKIYYSSYGEQQIYHAKYNEGDRLAFKKSSILQKKVVAITESKIDTAAGKVFLMSENDGPIMMYDKEFAGATPLAVFDLGGYPMDMLLSPDEKTLYVACIKGNKVVAVDIEDSSKQISYAVDTPSCLAQSSNGELLFVGSHRSRSLAVINLKNGNVSPLISTGEDTGNPMVLTVCDDNDRYTVYITKESYSERTKWTAADVIKPNTKLDMSVIAIYKPVPQ